MNALLIWLGLAASTLASAHPLGNNTVNREAGLLLSRTAVTLDYRVDIAEIPTLLATTDADTDGDGRTSKTEWARYARVYAERIQQGVVLRADGEPLSLRLDAARASLTPGAAGLSTLLISARFSAPLQAQTGLRLTYQDQRDADQPGWKEVYFRAANGLAVRASDVPDASRSQHLTAYPADAVPNELAASIEMDAIPPLPNPAPDKAEAPSSKTPPIGLAVVAAPPPSPRMALPQVRAPTPPPPPAIAPPVPAARAIIAPSPPAPRTLPAWSFFRLGVHHIAIGWDHLMFLLGLILAPFSLRVPPASHEGASLQTPAPSRLRRLIGIVTAFTVAHSLTLGLAASGRVALPGDWVEAAIALTIAYVGLMNLLGRNRHSTLLAFAFGLVHGFGFAGALAASMGNLRTQGHDWLLNLAAFNLGIEAFQLGLVIVLVPMLGWIARQIGTGRIFNTLSFMVMSAGLGWFFSRI